MILDLAIDYEFIGDQATDLLDAQEQELYDNAGQWFFLFGRLPYDATYSLEALLDCLEFLLRHYMLHQSYMIDIVQLGFGFRNLEARRRFVTSLEKLLYTYNL